MARWGNVTRVLSEMHVHIFAMKALKRRRPNAVITTESSRISGPVFCRCTLKLSIVQSNITNNVLY